MSFPCIDGAFTEKFCTPMCTRWESINRGEPLKVFIDTSNWDPNHYNGVFPFSGVILNEPDPTVYNVAALDLWQLSYPCGQLYEIVDDEALAQVVVRYPYTPVGQNPILAGNAECFCDNDNDVCVRQVDHSAQFIAGVNPAIMNIFLRDSGGNSTLNSWINLHAHEFGHILGMGHVYNPPITSVMGAPLNQNASLVVYDHDREQMEARHPCGCTLVLESNFIVPDSATPNLSSDFCQGCLAE